MNPQEDMLFALPGNENFTQLISEKCNLKIGNATIRYFPDYESYIRINSEVRDKRVILICSLHKPNENILPLYFLAKTMKEFGAKSICLVAPYLAYMRQDKRFNPGEVITSEYFAKLISTFADELVTIDPHLHRRHFLSEIYSIRTKVVHASELISKWIKTNVKNALLIGPDGESKQWVSEVAKNANAPYIIIEKTRLGDNEVKATIPQVEKFKDHTPVLVDDIISTAHTMMETIAHLKAEGMKSPVCIGIHAVFAGNAYDELKMSGAAEIITCNTIEHPSNRIDISELISARL